jgi:hypothetical protein
MPAPHLWEAVANAHPVHTIAGRGEDDPFDGAFVPEGELARHLALAKRGNESSLGQTFSLHRERPPLELGRKVLPDGDTAKGCRLRVVMRGQVSRSRASGGGSENRSAEE